MKEARAHEAGVAEEEEDDGFVTDEGELTPAYFEAILQVFKR